MASVMAPSLTARTGTSLFERDAKSIARDICKNLLSYCQISTDKVDRSGIYRWATQPIDIELALYIGLKLYTF